MSLKQNIKYKIFFILFIVSFIYSNYLIKNFIDSFEREKTIINLINNQKDIVNDIFIRYNDYVINKKPKDITLLNQRINLKVKSFLNNNDSILKLNTVDKMFLFQKKYDINAQTISELNINLNTVLNTIKDGKVDLNEDSLNQILNYYNLMLTDKGTLNNDIFFISKVMIVTTLFVTVLLLIILFDYYRVEYFEKIQKEYYKNLSLLFERSNNSLLFSINENREIIYFNETFKYIFGLDDSYINKKIDDLNIFSTTNHQTIQRILDSFNDKNSPLIKELNYLLLKDSNGYFLHYNIYITKIPTNKKGYNFIFNMVQTEDKDLKEKKYEENNRILKRLSLYDYSIRTLIDKLIFDEKIKDLDGNIIKKNIGLINIDIENFKNINKTFNYKFGDKLLKIFETKIKEKYKDVTLLNVGGSNFFVIKEESTKQELEEFIKEFYSFIKLPYEIENREIILHFNLAATIYPEINRNIKEILYEMNNLMYHSKNNSNKEMIFIKEEIKQKKMHIYELEQNLINRIKNNEIELFFQPQFNSKKNKIIGAESLIRWKYGNEYIPPLYFIPIAEKSDLIIKIGDIVIEKNFETMTYLKTNNFIDDEFTLSINVSTKQLLNKGLIQTLKDCLIKYPNVESRNFIMEITESSLIENKNLVLEILKEIKDMGFILALDDFGTGYSSLNYLSNYPFDELKIDRSFITDIEIEKQKINILKGVISISQLLDMKLIAEGVENVEQLEILKGEKCFNIQGYYYSVPLNLEDFSKKLQINQDEIIDAVDED